MDGLFCIVEMLSLLHMSSVSLLFFLFLSSVCLWPNTRLPPQLCQLPFFSISVLMNLETKVERKRLQAASVSSFSTKIRPRYDCHHCRDSTPITCGQITPTSTDVLLFWRIFVVKENYLNIVQRIYGCACFGGTNKCNIDDLKCVVDF